MGRNEYLGEWGQTEKEREGREREKGSDAMQHLAIPRTYNPGRSCLEFGKNGGNLRQTWKGTWSLKLNSLPSLSTLIQYRSNCCFLVKTFVCVRLVPSLKLSLVSLALSLVSLAPCLSDLSLSLTSLYLSFSVSISLHLVRPPTFSNHLSLPVWSLCISTTLSLFLSLCLSLRFSLSLWSLSLSHAPSLSLREQVLWETRRITEGRKTWALKSEHLPDKLHRGNHGYKY